MGKFALTKFAVAHSPRLRGPQLGSSCRPVFEDDGCFAQREVAGGVESSHFQIEADFLNAPDPHLLP